MAESMIRGIWREELARSKELLSFKERSLHELPKGSIQIKRIKGREYYYLFYREGGRVKSNYLGSDPRKFEVLRKQIDRRKALELSIKRSKEDIRLLEKAVRLK